MQKLFNKILVPIDFSAGSRNTVEKAAEIAQQYNCSIHLLHVLVESPLNWAGISLRSMMTAPGNIELKEEFNVLMQQMRNYTQLLAGNAIEASYSILKGMWDDTIIGLVEQYQFDVVLIGQREQFIGRRNMLINPDKIASKTNIAVITIPFNRSVTDLFSVVIPITEFLPVRKIMYGIYLASGKNTLLRLLGVENEKTKDTVRHYLNKAYILITDNCNVKVEPEIMLSGNVAEAVSQYAMLKSADLVILNPGIQTKMPGFFSSLFGHIIQKYVAPPVLTINPV